MAEEQEEPERMEPVTPAAEKSETPTRTSRRSAPGSNSAAPQGRSRPASQDGNKWDKVAKKAANDLGD